MNILTTGVSEARNTAAQERKGCSDRDMTGAIFDMDGLLLDTECIFQRTWREMAAERGVTLDESFTAAVCGNSREGTKSVLARWFPGTDTEAFMTEATRRVFEKEASTIPLKKGTLTILEGMRAEGWRLAVASSSGTEMVLRNLRVAGIDHLFDAIVSGPDVVHGKPAPDIFLYAAGRIGVPPADCYVFEDSLNGIRAGYASGARAVMIPDMIPPTEEIRALCFGIWPDLGTAWTQILRGHSRGV